jgi:hypothetical protein
MIIYLAGYGYCQVNYPFSSKDNQSILAYWYNCKSDIAVEAGVKDTAHMNSTLQIYGPVPADSFNVQAEVYVPNDIRAYSNKFLVRKDMKSSTFKTEVLNNHFLITIPVYQLKDNPQKMRIIITSAGMNLEKWIDCRYHKVYGYFTDFGGNPLKSYILIRSDGFYNVSGVWSDTSGYYEIYLPERIYNCFYVNDGNYKLSTLEAWAWHMIVDEDQKLDFKIGTGEVYNLNVWPSNGGANNLYISFRPMVLYYKNSGDTVKKFNNKEFNLVNIAPDLELDNMAITINGIQTEKYTLQKYFETAKDWAMPAYLIQLRRLMPCIGKQTIRVEYEKIIELDGKKVLQNSMGYYQFYPNFYGFSNYN